MLQLTTAYTRFARTQGVMLPREQRGGDLAIEFHPRVERWVNYYLTTGRGSMVKYLERSGAYFPMIEDVLAEKGLPEDLKYLPIIESGFSPYAYSPAAASGLWQFIPSTGRRFGMQIDEWVDERRDPLKATYAAAGYLTFLYDMFDDWALALAAYNCGEACVSRSIANSGSHNYWDLALPAETMDYVPKVVAAATIARDPESYGFSVQPDPPIQLKRIPLGGVADLRSLSAKTGLDYDQVKLFNPELKSANTPPNRTPYELNIPLVHAEKFEQSLASLGASAYLSPDDVKKLTAPPQTVSRSKLVYYKVKKGDSLGKIARRYKTTVTSIKRLNRIKGSSIRAGQTLKIQPGAKK
jgi:membrane-bound lytic murein transglycosylase D